MNVRGAKGKAAATAAALAVMLPPVPARAAEPLRERYCYSCHDDDSQKGEGQLDGLGPLEPDARNELLNRVRPMEVH